LFGSEKLPDYSATKGAINAFTKTLAQSLIDKGIRVNAVAPGPVWTPLNPSDAGLEPKDVAKFGKQSPLGRPAQPEELAPAYVFLASNADSSYITGTVLQVMGGETTGGCPSAVQLDVWLGPPRDHPRDGIERRLPEAVQRELVHLVERQVHH